MEIEGLSRKVGMQKCRILPRKHFEAGFSGIPYIVVWRITKSVEKGANSQIRRYVMPRRKRTLSDIKVTWAGKGLLNMTAKEIKDAKALLMSAWSVGAPQDLVEAACGLSAEDIEQIRKQDPYLRDYQKNQMALLIVQAETNIGQDVKKGNVNTSKWVAERLDPKYSKKSDVSVKGEPVVVSVEDKEKAITEMMEGLQVGEFSQDG